MKLAIMQPYFFPYIGYFQAIYAVDKYILYSNLSFIKDGWMNRNRISIKDGTVSMVTVPLIHKSSNTFIYHIRVDNSRKWNTKLLKTIYLNYKGSPYFEEVYPLLESVLTGSYDYLYELNASIISSIAHFIGIKTPVEFRNKEKYLELEDQLLKVEEGDYTDFPYLLKTTPVKKVARVLALSKNEQADTFVNAIGGQVLYDKGEFAQYGIDLKFLQTDHFSYPQFSNEFTPDLSIIDVLMHNGSVKTLELIKKYTLV